MKIIIAIAISIISSGALADTKLQHFDVGPGSGPATKPKTASIVRVVTPSKTQTKTVPQSVSSGPVITPTPKSSYATVTLHTYEGTIKIDPLMQSMEYNTEGPRNQIGHLITELRLNTGDKMFRSGFEKPLWPF